ncbi:MBL fold metallo-hydrolase [Deinococcus sonorensis]|uniref:MBL fold metallo-hydrolase n=2 Tax=Deinococcus sonorensis TaxID=309891 RepID=A0AAU7UAZ9_9DEIO
MCAAPLHHLTGSLYTVQVPIPYPMRTVTVLIDAASPVTLVDTSLNTPEAIATLEDALAQLGLHWESIERVVLTHQHPDHAGLSGLIEERSGASVHLLDENLQGGGLPWQHFEAWQGQERQHLLAHGLPPALLEGVEAEARRTRDRVTLATRLTPLTAGDQLTLGGHRWTVLWLPGHADGHLGLWQPQLDLLIAGDAILPRISPNVGLGAQGRSDPLGDYLQTLERLRQLNPATAVVGHYGPTMSGVAERAAELSAHHHERLALVEETLRVTPMHAHQLSAVMFPRELDARVRRFALTEALAHAEHLRLKGLLDRRWTGDTWLYFGE